MAIGDDLQILLGMVPIRDRAGIARGTMADAAVAAANPHANGQELTRQGFDFARPPALSLPPSMGQDVQLPDGVNTEYTSGSGGRAMSPAKPPLKQPLPPPEPTERVVASSPAAAPSPEVVRGSDVLMKAYEQQQRQQRMQAIIQSIGGMVSSLQGQPVHGGGGGAAAGGPDLNSLKTIIDMRNAENQQAAALAIRKQTIEELQRSNGYSPEYAAAKYDSGEFKDDLKQDTIAKREAAKLAGTTREALLKPENVDALSKRLGQPPDVIRADIRNGKLGAKDLADIEGTQSQTAERNQKTDITGADYASRQEARTSPEAVATRLSTKLGRPINAGEVLAASLSDPGWQDYLKQLSAGGQAAIEGTAAKAAQERANTAKTQQETALKTAEIAEYDSAKANPLDVMKLYDLSPTQYDKATRDRPSWDAFKLSQSGAGAADYSTYQAEKAAALKADPSKTFPDYAKWKQSQTPKTIETPTEKGEAGTVTHLATELAKEHARIKTLQKDLEIDQPMAQGLFNEKQLGGSKLAEMTLSGRKILGAMFLPEGTYDDKVVQAETFFNTIRERVLARAREFPGALSNDDRVFLERLSGTMDMSPQTLRNLMTIREKIARSEITRFNRDIEAHKANTDSPGLQGAAKPYAPVSLPDPGRFIKENFARQGGQAFLRKAAADGTLDTPEFVRKFEEHFGAQSLPYFRAKSGL